MIIDGEDENSSVFVCMDCDRKRCLWYTMVGTWKVSDMVFCLCHKTVNPILKCYKQINARKYTHSVGYPQVEIVIFHHRHGHNLGVHFSMFFPTECWNCMIMGHDDMWDATRSDMITWLVGYYWFSDEKLGWPWMERKRVG